MERSKISCSIPALKYHRSTESLIGPSVKYAAGHMTFARVSSWDDTSNLPCCGPSNSVSIYLQSVFRAVFYTYLTLFSHGTKKNKEKTCISKILV